MKKYFVILLSLMTLFAMTFSAVADEPMGSELDVKLFIKLNNQYYFADVADEKSDEIRVGETLNLAFSDFSEFSAITSSANNAELGIMLVDDSKGNGFVTYHLSDLTIRTSNNSNYTVSAEGTFSGNLEYGIYEDDTALIHNIDMSEKADILANLGDITQVDLSLNYISYENHSPMPIESETEEEEIPDVNVPNTGISAFVLLPTVAALALVFNKRR